MIVSYLTGVSVSSVSRSLDFDGMTSTVLGRISFRVYVHCARVIVLFAILTTHPIGVSAFGEGAHPHVDQLVVANGRANDKVLGSVIGSNLVDVVDDGADGQRFPHGALSYRDVREFSRFAAADFLNISGAGLSGAPPFPPLPIRDVAMPTKPHVVFFAQPLCLGCGSTSIYRAHHVSHRWNYAMQQQQTASPDSGKTGA